MTSQQVKKAIKTECKTPHRLCRCSVADNGCKIRIKSGNCPRKLSKTLLN